MGRTVHSPGGRDNAANSRYRVFQDREPLRRNGVSCRVIEPPRRKIVQWHLWFPWIAQVLSSGITSRCIFVQKGIFSLGLWRLFKAKGRRI